MDNHNFGVSSQIFRVTVHGREEPAIACCSYLTVHDMHTGAAAAREMPFVVA